MQVLAHRPASGPNYPLQSHAGQTNAVGDGGVDSW